MTRKLLKGVVAKLGSSQRIRKAGIAIAGFSVLAVGVAMIVLPGPAILVIPLGLAILSKEFPWARRLAHWLKGCLRRLWAGARRVFGMIPSGASR